MKSIYTQAICRFLCAEPRVVAYKLIWLVSFYILKVYYFTKLKDKAIAPTVPIIYQ